MNSTAVIKMAYRFPEKYLSFSFGYHQTISIIYHILPQLVFPIILPLYPLVWDLLI